VFGVPRWVNEHFIANVTGVKNVLMKNPMFNHSLPRDTTVKGLRIRDFFALRLRAAVERARRFDHGALVLQDDISAFDRNVRPVHHDSLQDHYALSWGSAAAANWREAHTMGILAPAWGSSMDDGFMYERPNGGTTTSGLISTSTDGCILNDARVLTCMAAALGVSVSRAEAMRVEGRWAVFIWGDDTLLVAPSSFDHSAYTQASLDAGFPCKLDTPPVFLMTYIDWQNGKGYSLGSRILANRVFPERAPHIPILRLVGLIAGMDAMEGSPLQSAIWDILREDDIVTNRSIRSLASLFAYGASPAMRLEIESAIDTKTGPDADTAQWLQNVTSHGFGSDLQARELMRAFGDHIGIRLSGWTSNPYEAAAARRMLPVLARDLRHDAGAAKEKWLPYAEILDIHRSSSTEEQDDDTAK
jgi:hypothetical protein